MTPITPKEERFCPFCPRVVEDEVHFLLECPVYSQPRKELIKKVVIKNPHFTHKSVAQKFAELMTPQNAQFVAKTVHNFFEIRNFDLKPQWHCVPVRGKLTINS